MIIIILLNIQNQLTVFVLRTVMIMTTEDYTGVHLLIIMLLTLKDITLLLYLLLLELVVIVNVLLVIVIYHLI